MGILSKVMYAWALGSSLLGTMAMAQTDKKPNVIIILTDDQGYGDIAAHGNKVIQTPTMDKLHDEGVRFTNFHSGTTCAPSRSGLLTGADGNRAGVWHTIGGASLLREKFVLMPQVFEDNGYATGMYGKWHLGDAYPYRPQDRGFQETVVHGGGGVGQTPDYWQNNYFDDTYWRNGVPEKFEGYCTDIFFSEAMDFMERKKDHPFFLYISLNAPHGPLNVPQKYYDMYKGEKTINDDQKAYYGMITNIDDNIALLDKKLEVLGLKDNTILIFMTDNGTQTGHKVVKGKVQGYNAGMRGHKGSQYEGGHRVPFLMRWKDGKLTGGRSIDQLAMNFDVLPTLIDLCDLGKVPNLGYDGKSLAPLLNKEVEKLPHRYCVVDNNRLQQPVKWRMSAVMDDDWRLIDGKELYHIRKDPGQEKDIASKHPEKVREMREAYEKWWDYTSRDFSHYEAYKIGVPTIQETAITVHDLHSSDPIAWNQSYIRNPESGKKPAFADGFYMIDVQRDGYYEIELRRWPKESNLAFNATPPQLGQAEKWYNVRPEGVSYPLKSASLDIDALHLDSPVDMKSTNVTFKTYLVKGRKHLKANFTREDGVRFGAFYVYLRKVGALSDQKDTK
ncbi:Arylsulfatase A [Zobellia uliginosa]|uniref:Arylsulfatase A n=1 Tax=Zobellia uliginosa TaxID=143224 RepID=A0ABY1KMB1_9FLAO|nr:arylsulfatase [Zobellia uliginosa]SIS48702.1 Arylsulfatase A [Zobellia uliginosa]